MKKPKPPKRRILKDGIPLNDSENERFLRFMTAKGFDQFLGKFMKKTGLYLRGRCDGPKRSGTDPCGYVFISKESFGNGHASILFFDPMPNNTPLNISFRPWKDILPFSKKEWEDLDGDDRMQKKMRILELTSESKLQRAIALAKKARKTFEESFYLSAKLS